MLVGIIESDWVKVIDWDEIAVDKIVIVTKILIEQKDIIAQKHHLTKWTKTQVAIETVQIHYLITWEINLTHEVLGIAQTKLKG